MVVRTHLTNQSQFVQSNAGFNGTNISGTIASSGISLSVAAPGAANINLSAGTTSNNGTQFVFSNSNGVSFGLNGSTLTATVATNYLTTGALSNHSHNFATTTTNGSVIVVATTNSNGATIAVPPYLTTAQSPGAYLTTARASNDAIGLNTALTGNGVAWTVNSSGLSLNVPAFLTTAALSNHSHGNPSLALTNLSGTTASNSAGLTLSLSAAAPGGGGAAISGGANSQSTGTVNFANSNGITFGLSNNGTMTASHNGLTTARASNDAVGLNTALTAGPLAWTVNSAGISLNAGSAAGTTSGFAGNLISGSMTHNTAGLNLSLSHPGWLTTAALSNHSHGNPTLALTNLSGTTASNSAGLTLSLSAASPGGGGGIALANSQTTYTSGTAHLSVVGGAMTIASTTGQSFNFSVPALSSFVAVGNATISTNGSTVSISVQSIAAAPVNFSAGTTSNNIGSIVFSNSNGVSFGLNGSTMTASVAESPAATASLWYPYNEAVNVMGAQGNATWQFAPVPTPMDRDGGYVTVDRVVFPMFVTNATNSTGTVTVSLSMGLYTLNASSLSLAHSASGSFAVTFSGTVNNSTYAGIRLVTIPFSTSINADRYYVGIAYRSTTGGANATVSQVLVSQLNSNFSGLMGVASNRSYQWPLGLGVRSASSSGFFSSIAISQIDGTASLAARPPSWHMRLGTV